MYITAMRMKHQLSSHILDECMYCSWLLTSKYIMDAIIASSGVATKSPINHSYLEDDANTISFLLYERVRRMPFGLGDVEEGDGTWAGPVPESRCCRLSSS